MIEMSCIYCGSKLLAKEESDGKRENAHPADISCA